MTRLLSAAARSKVAEDVDVDYFRGTTSANQTINTAPLSAQPAVSCEGLIGILIAAALTTSPAAVVLIEWQAGLGGVRSTDDRTA